jgi:hypothetical protein
MTFASMFAKIKVPVGDVPYSLWIQGQMYHLISLLYPNEENKL